MASVDRPLSPLSIPQTQPYITETGPLLYHAPRGVASSTNGGCAGDAILIDDESTRHGLRISPYQISHVQRDQKIKKYKVTNSG